MVPDDDQPNPPAPSASDDDQPNPPLASGPADDQPRPPPAGRPATDRPAITPGASIIRAAWWGTGLFVAVAVAATIAPGTFGGATLALDVALFGAGCVLFGLAFLRAADRSRTDAIGIGGLFFLAGDTAPPAVRRHLVGAVVIQVVVGLTTAGIRLYSNLAAGTLVPVFGLGLCGLWAARYGHFGPRPPQPTRARPPAAGGPPGLK